MTNLPDRLKSAVARAVRGRSGRGVEPPAGSYLREPTHLRRLPGTPELLPSLGYFGGIGASYLSMPVNGPVSQIQAHLPHKFTGQVDLRGFGLYLAGKPVQVPPADQTILQSSAAPTQPEGADPFTYGTLRTRREDGPWWSVTLARPVEADEIRIYNRRDGFGVRNRRLTIAIADSDDTFHTLCSVDSDSTVERTIGLVSRLIGRDIGTDVLESEDASRQAHVEVVSDLARIAEKGILTADAEEQRLLTALVPTRLPEDATLSDDECALAGHLLAAERLRVPATATSMQAYQLVLRSTTDLRRLEAAVNRAGAAIGGEEAVLTRHGFRDVGVLRKHSAEYVTTMQHATELLAELGKPAMMAYGTLLGVVREGDFLAHDDDVDMLIPLEVATRAEAEPILAELRTTIAERGWKVSRPNNQLNFHITDPSTGFHIDLFPLLVAGKQTTLHMEKMKLRPIRTSLVLPPAELSFKGADLLAPADPEGFLAERYGPTWGTPNPFYDWPWKLADAED